MGEVPLLKRLREAHEKDGLALVGVSVDQSAEALDKMVASKGIQWPQLWGAQAYEAEIPKLFALDGTPLLYLIDRAGRLAGRFQTGAAMERALPEVLDAFPDVPRARRDEWQRPNGVMSRLGIRAGSVVADVGAGEGYFTRHLAARVGARGKLYAVDVDAKALDKLKESAKASGATQVETVLSTPEDPKLPSAALDAALIVDAYHEFTAADAMLQRLYAALRHGGRLAIVDASDALGRTRAEYQERHRLPVEIVVEEAARHGFRLASFDADYVARPTDSAQYLIVFEKPK